MSDYPRQDLLEEIVEAVLTTNTGCKPPEAVLTCVLAAVYLTGQIDGPKAMRRAIAKAMHNIIQLAEKEDFNIALSLAEVH